MMAIDDPLDTAEERIPAEERLTPPLSRFVRSLAELSEAIPQLPERANYWGRQVSSSSK